MEVFGSFFVTGINGGPGSGWGVSLRSAPCSSSAVSAPPLELLVCAYQAYVFAPARRQLYIN
jgi:hypothetical protein